MSKENKTKTIFRVDKVKGYSIVDNTAANDTRLSYGAIGVMYKALTKPDDWKFYIQDFSNTSSDGITKVSRYFKELRLAGYFELVKVRNELGQIIDSEYVVHEKPLHTNPIKGSKPKTKNLIKGFHRNSENPISGNNNNREIQESVNVKLLNTDNILNTDNNKILIEHQEPIQRYDFHGYKKRLMDINKKLNLTYLESNKANQYYEKAQSLFSNPQDFNKYFESILSRLEIIASKPIDKFSPIQRGITIESLTKFNCELCSKIESYYNKINNGMSLEQIQEIEEENKIWM